MEGVGFLRELFRTLLLEELLPLVGEYQWEELVGCPEDDGLESMQYFLLNQFQGL